MNSETGTPYTVLIVDDDPDLLQLLIDGLGLVGHFNVMSAEDGEQGLERFFESKPDCVIIDVVMPGLNGIQLVQALRGDPDSATTPLIMLTAMAQDRDKFAGLAVGADQYLIKPVTPRSLIAAVHQAVTINDADRRQQVRKFAQESEDAPPGQ